METVQFSPNFILAAVNVELARAKNKSAELKHLDEIGYRDSQTGLDIARDVKSHLAKAYELLERVDDPAARLLQCNMAVTMAKQDMIIKHIELSL